jgi:hypothetical protein
MLMFAVRGVITSPLPRLAAVRGGEASYHPSLYSRLVKLRDLLIVNDSDSDSHSDRNSSRMNYNSNSNITATKNKSLTLHDLENLLDLTGASPPQVHLNHDGVIDWTQYDHIQLYHTRKAGGSSLLNWARLVAVRHNLTISQHEGHTYDPSDWNDPIWQGRVFVFTSLRRPVDRVISSYQYDLLESKLDKNAKDNLLLVHHDNETHPTLGQFFVQTNDQNNGKNGGRNTHGVWRSSIGRHAKVRIEQEQQRILQKRPPVRLPRGWIWVCASNCYSKWFGGWPNPDLQPDAKTATKNLDQLEIVWMNSLQDEEYVKWLLHRWNATDIPMPHSRKTANRVRQNYTQEELNLLHNGNVEDKLLYEALKNKWSKITQRNLQ